MSDFKYSDEHDKIFKCNKKNMLINASAGSGKTSTMIRYISQLIENKQPVKRMLILTFTKAAANEMKERLLASLTEKNSDENFKNQIDDVFTSDISTIHSFLEKIIKRNIGQFPQFEGFKIIDENQSMILKEEAFKEAFKKLKEEDIESYMFLNLVIRDVILIKEIIFSLSFYLSAQSSKIDSLNMIFDMESNQIKAKNYLNQYLLDKISSLKNQLSYFPCQDNEKVKTYIDGIYFLTTKINDRGLKENLELINGWCVPRQPVMSNYPKKNEVVYLKEELQKIIKFSKKVLPSLQASYAESQTKKLFIGLKKLYIDYETVYSNKKQELSYLDFNDLESKSEELLQYVDLLNELQNNYDYVFIDEYQDTNPVQEKIVKMISENGKFIAIGDPKQGIYGFRNATSSIILKDSQNFINSENGETFYLSKNYRSDKQILRFVNNVFSKVMKKEITGIDYEKTSKMTGDKENEKTGYPVVEIDVVGKDKPKKEGGNFVYDIFKDPLVNDEKSELEAKLVAIKIEQFLSTNFIDPVSKQSRKVQPSDIAILSRSKSDLCESIMNELSKKNIPFISSLRTNLLDKPYISLVISLLSLCVDLQDDINLASYLLSPFCNLNLDKIALMRYNSKEKFFEQILKSNDEEIKNALDQLLIFKNNCLFLGAKLALEKLFIEKEFFVYLKSQMGENAVAEVESLLSSISTSPNDKDLPELISYLKTSSTFSNVSSQNAVTFSTIHASKGLEYPIVFLVGTGKPIIKNDNALFKIGNDFGLGMMIFDLDKKERFPSVALHATRHKAKRQERVDELMILYVALTRAKSHLVITGSLSEEDQEDFSLDKFYDYTSTLSLILSTRPEMAGVVINKIDDIATIENKAQENICLSKNKDLQSKITEYLNFDYPFKNDLTVKQKASVTELVGRSYNNENSDEFIMEGVAYHEALKLINFEMVKSVDDIKNQLKLNNFNEKYLNLLNFSLIFENIKLIQPLIAKKQIIKEKEFTMLLPAQYGAKMVQGIIDLYLKGDKNILIDYKYSRESDERKLIDKYSKQLDLYKLAIENAEQIKIDEIYLISLKYKKLIKYK